MNPPIRNLLTETEFRNGLTDALVKAGSLTSVSFTGLTQGTGIQVNTNTSGTYIYKSATIKANTSYTFSFYVRMLDGTAPRFGTGVSVSAVDVCLVFKSSVYPATVEDLGGGLFRASATLNSTQTGANFGVVKYAGNSTKPVIISGYQLEEGTLTDYQPITDFNTEFLKEFPTHALYQDVIGTIPVAAAGQPVGLMKDKSGRNNHAFQTASASRPLLKQTPILGNELANNDGWISSYIDNITTKLPDGRYKIERTSTQSARLIQPVALIEGRLYSASVEIETLSVTVKIQTFLSNYSSVGAVVLGTVPANTRTTVNAYFTAPTGAVNIGGLMITEQLGEGYILGKITVREVTGYRTDQNYLQFDGVDDFLQTNNIDFTMTDKVSLFAGVRKLSDAATGVVAEFSAISTTNTGTFSMYAPYDVTLKGYAFRSRYSTSADTITVSPLSPDTSILTGHGDISGDKATLRINGIMIAQKNTDQGSGNYGNYPIYIGRRGGVNFPFNGYLYGLIGIGRLTTDSETIALEKETAKRTGVTLDV